MPLDTTDKYIRARVRMPEEFQEGSFRTVTLSADLGIYSVQGKLKGSSSMTIQSYLFERTKGRDMPKIKTWLKEHKITGKEGASMENKMEIWEGNLSIKADKPKGYREVKDDKGNVIDYQDVRLEGYANTFNLDRGGDQVVQGAFVEHLEEFLTNPILLVDHVRETGFAAGQVQSAYEDNNGLKITALLSNSPSEKNKDLRFKAVERVLRTFSIGGRFHGKMVELGGGESRFMVTKVELREISVVTVPMNKESLFEIKQVSDSQSLEDRADGKIRFELVEDEQEKLYVDIEGEKLEIV